MGEVFGTYSFADVHAMLTGPGLVAILGDGSGSSEEGITFEPVDERDRMTIGADGTGMHSLSQNRSAKVRVRVLKTSPINSVLQLGLNYQSSFSGFWGVNRITVSNPVTGDQLTATGVAFERQPPNTWGKDSNLIEWSFTAIYASQTLGNPAQLLGALLGA
jgi:hypothetical protein